MGVCSMVYLPWLLVFNHRHHHSHASFPSFNAVALGQLVFTIVLLYAMKIGNVISFPPLNYDIIPKVGS